MVRQYPIKVAFVAFSDIVRSSAELEDQLAQLNNLVQIVSRFNAKLTLLVSGSFANRALTDGHRSVFLDLIQQGHEVGTYVTPHVKVAENFWNDVSSQIPLFPNLTPRNDSLMFRVWAEHAAAVNSLIGSSNNTTVHSDYFLIASEELLVTNNQFTTTFANRNSKALEYIGYSVPHPFRPAISNVPGYELKEFTQTQFIYVDGFTSINNSGSPFSCPDLRPLTIAKAFYNRYLDWSSVEDNRAWCFAFSTSLSHPELNDEVNAIFGSINNYVGQLTTANEFIANYSTVHNIRSDLIFWESTNPPNSSSFSFVKAPLDLQLPESRLHVQSSQLFVNSLGVRKLFTRIHKPDIASSTHKKPGIVMMSGDGSITPRFSPNELAQLGYVVIIYDRAGKGQSSGANDLGGLNDQDDLKTIIDYLRSQDYVDPNNVGIISLGFGLVISAGTLNRYPSLKISYLVDWEGPSNRYNISEFDKTEDFSLYGLNNDSFWAIREPFETIQTFQGRYLRLQGSVDHFQGTNVGHAIQMVNSATNVSFGGAGSCSQTILNGNTPNRTYDASLANSADNPLLWISGESVNRIAEDNAPAILKYFKNIANYARLGISLAVIVPGIEAFEQDVHVFQTVATRLRRLSNIFTRAKAKLSVLVENTFANGCQTFSDDILVELTRNGHSVGTLINIPSDDFSEHSKQKYIIDTKSNIDGIVGTANNISAMGALTLEDPNFLFTVGIQSLSGPLLNVPHNLARASVVRTLSSNLLRTDPGFLTADDPLGNLYYLPGDLSKISSPGGISPSNTKRATNSIIISRNLIDPNRINSWYIFLDITDFTERESNELAILEQWATQDIGILVEQGELIWKNFNELITENQQLINRENLVIPDTPVDLTAVPADHVISLSWKRSVSTNIVGYLILRAQNCFGKNYVAIGTTLQTDPKFASAENPNVIQYSDIKAQNGVEYCYVVKAFTADTPPIFSNISNEVCAIARDYFPPPAPEIIDIIAGNRTAAISWTQITAPDNRFFRVYRRTVDGSNPINLTEITDICDLRENFDLVAELDGKIFRFVDSGLINNQPYIYVISAVDVDGNEAFDISNATNVVPYENLATPPIWIATGLGVSMTSNQGTSFTTLNSCGTAFNDVGFPPVFQAPADRAIVSDPINVVITVGDFKGLQKVEVGIGSDTNLQLCIPTGAGTFTAVVNANQYADGSTVALFAVATNSVGIVTKSSIAVQIKDIAGPQITILSPQNNADTPETVTTSFTVQVQALDPTGVQQVSVSINGAPFQCAKQLGSCNFWYLPVDARHLPATTTISVTATDFAGVVSNPATAVVTVNNALDTAGPQITVLSPYNGAEISGHTLFAVEAVDPSGVGNVQISFNGALPEDMSFGNLTSNNLLLTNGSYPYWSLDGTKMCFINNNKIYQVGIDSNGGAGPATLLWGGNTIPVQPTNNAIANPSFENTNNFTEPLNWEIGIDPNAAFIVLDIGNQIPLTNVYIGAHRSTPAQMPVQVVLNPGSFSEGDPVITTADVGIFIWHVPSNPGNIWHIAAKNLPINVTGGLFTEAGAVDIDVSMLSLMSSVTFPGTQQMIFTFEANRQSEFTFVTPGAVNGPPKFAVITNQATDGKNGLELILGTPVLH